MTRRALSAGGKARSKDFDVRACVVRRLLEEGVARSDIRHETTLDTYSCGGRVDMAVLRDRWIMAIEIKSGSDCLDRLADQQAAMCRAFDYARIVIDARLEPKLSDDLWGVFPIWYSHDSGGFVRRYRGEWKPEEDPRISLPQRWHESRRAATPDMASLLWKNEICPISGAAGGATKTRTDAIDWIRENMALKDLRPGVIEALRGRVPNRWEEAFWREFDALPESEAA